MNIKYLELAKLEFHDAISYYEKEQSGLGKRFEDNIKASISRIKVSPKLYPVLKYEVRKCTLHKFPFNVLYALKEEHIVVIAIAHQHRKPDYWVERI